MASPPHFSSTRGGIKKNPCTKTKKGRRRILTTGSEVKEAGAASCRWDTSAEKEGDLKGGRGVGGWGFGLEQMVVLSPWREVELSEDTRRMVKSADGGGRM